MTLYDVKAGDTVLQYSYGSWDDRVVKRTTKTQIVFGNETYEAKYRRSDGQRVGESYSRSSIKAVTPKELEDFLQRQKDILELNQLRNEAKSLVDQINTRCMTKEDAEELVCFLKNEWKQGI